jgi:hypothetical protein
MAPEATLQAMILEKIKKSRDLKRASVKLTFNTKLIVFSATFFIN